MVDISYWTQDTSVSSSYLNGKHMYIRWLTVDVFIVRWILWFTPMEKLLIAPKEVTTSKIEKLHNLLQILNYLNFHLDCGLKIKESDVIAVDWMTYRFYGFSWYFFNPHPFLNISYLSRSSLWTFNNP